MFADPGFGRVIKAAMWPKSYVAAYNRRLACRRQLVGSTSTQAELEVILRWRWSSYR